MAASLTVDIELSKWFLTEHAPRFVHKLSSVAEPFGNGIGVIFICVAMFQLDKARRRDLVPVLLASLGAGMLANLIKITVVRVRPVAYTFDGSVWDTFWPFLDSPSFSSAYQSFPSGHTTTAVGLALTLGFIYPRVRGLFYTLALLVGVHRVCVGAHYLSDVFAGATVGYLVGILCCRVHLWKWRNTGAVAPRSKERTTSVPKAHLDRAVSASRLRFDGSARGDQGGSSGSAAS